MLAVASICISGNNKKHDNNNTILFFIYLDSLSIHVQDIVVSKHD